MSPVTDDKQFINFRECVISGYEQSAIVYKVNYLYEENTNFQTKIKQTIETQKLNKNQRSNTANQHK